ncbi:MAG TPA: A/G-specific adenine glycosylase [Candidatus Didemnitutus sp.]
MPPLLKSRRSFQRALHAWYRKNARPLPWRVSPSLYGTVVSEFMLQQTQVATVLPYFERWMAALPDFAALATAPADTVMRLWAGLGYYSRARNLHKLALAVQARPGMPRTPGEWCELPGIGPYTAAAITSIAQGHAAACVDGNVVRVLARLTNERREFKDNSDAAAFFHPLADSLIVGSRPGDHNQAMMELGATICTRSGPRCTECPVAAFCAGRRHGDPAAMPRLRPKQYESRAVARAWCVHRGRLLLHRAGHGQRRLGGLHELPELIRLGVSPEACDLLLERRRSVTRFRIRESIYSVTWNKTIASRIARDSTFVFVPVDGLDEVALSGPHARWVRELVVAT